MEILILGGSGMLGHKLFQRLRASHPDTVCTIRRSLEAPSLRHVRLFHSGNVIDDFDVSHFSCVDRLLTERKPKVVINCIGVVKQRAAALEAIPSIDINALLPHCLAATCESIDSRLIHFSTDCVFSGDKGGYTEEDSSDARDLYGRSKYLGEVAVKSALTIRTSIIGRELSHYQSLLEWLLQQDGKRIPGYTRAIYSGVTTNYLARVVEQLIDGHPNLEGLFQVTAPSISKFDLLCQLRDAYHLNIEIIPDSAVSCDRSMKGEKFSKATGLVAPTWPELIRELSIDATPYDEWK
jgi:dTDP-4-dehydrorhamnose reductase